VYIGKAYANRVKAESAIAHDFKGIKAFNELTGTDFTGSMVLYGYKDVLSFGQNCWTMPFHMLRGEKFSFSSIFVNPQSYLSLRIAYSLVL
jgi:hypothetical protein